MEIAHMTKGFELRTQDTKELQNIIKTIETTLKKHSKLDMKLGLSDKLLGPLGEAKGLIKIIENKKANCLWYGKFKKGYDLVIIEKDKPARYQIKTSSNSSHFLFRVFDVKFGIEELPTVMQQLKNKNPKPILDGIDKAVDAINTDFWLLVYIKMDETVFYKLDKEAMKTITKQAYENYYNKPHHREKTNFSVSQKSGKCMVMLSGKNLGDKELLNKYEYR